MHKKNRPFCARLWNYVGKKRGFVDKGKMGFGRITKMLYLCSRLNINLKTGDYDKAFTIRTN